MTRNPQAEQMAHESMLRNLAAQAEALWPQERPVIEAYGVATDARALDVGCGSGEAVARLAETFPGMEIVGIDVHAPHLEVARERCRAFGARVHFETGDAFELGFEPDAFDLVLCRHMLQAVPEPARVLAEMARVARPGGRLHLVAEDYAMIHFHPTSVDIDRFFLDGPCVYAQATGTDLRSGRAMLGALRALGLEDLRLAYAVLDTERVPRSVLDTIFRAWRDGYTDCISEGTSLSREHVKEAFEAMLACLAEPQGYAVWHVPLVGARVPQR